MNAFLHLRYTDPLVFYDPRENQDARDYYQEAKTVPFYLADASAVNRFVSERLENCRGVVLKTAFKRTVNSNVFVLSMHAIDLDAEIADKEKLKKWLINGGTDLPELLHEFPEMRECFDAACKLVDAAAAMGRVAFIISTGQKGFRVMMPNAEELYAVVSKEAISSIENVKSVVKPKLKSFFGIEKLPKCIDYSIWGSNKGVRTNFFTHPATGLWPLLLNAESKIYGAVERDESTYRSIKSFWTSVLQNVPALSEEEEREKEKEVVMERAARKTWLKGNPKRKRDDNDVEEQNTKECQSKLIASIKEFLLDQHGWVPQKSCLDHIDESRNVTYLIIDKAKSKPWFCPIAKRVHHSNTFWIKLNFVTQEVLETHCMDADCKDVDPPDTFFSVLKEEHGRLTNHLRIALAMQGDVKKRVAFDSMRDCWRIFNSKTGSWERADKDDCITEIGKILWIILSKIEPRTTDEEKIVSKAKSKCGEISLLKALCSLFKSIGKVHEKEWMEHFRGYLPVQNALLHFDVESGQVITHSLTSQQYVRSEYQADIKWVPDAPRHEPLESLLNSWWDESERVSWTEFIAYALSRTAFTERLALACGPPGAAKSTLIKMLEHWFGNWNVFMQTSASFVASNDPNAKMFDDDGNGHNTLLMSCLDKALVVFPEPSHKAVLRDVRVKAMTGDTQTGRVAHSADIKSVPRTYTPLVLCNYLPTPLNPNDTAMKSRIQILTMHHVFFRNEEHKRDLERKMTPQQKADAKMIFANGGVVDKVIKDPAAATAFLNILAKAWFSLIVEQKRVFVSSTLAKTVEASYWSSEIEEADSVAAFLQDQVQLTDDAKAYLPKRNLFLAYTAWHKWSIQTNASPGEICSSEKTFNSRVKVYFGPVMVADVQRNAHIYADGNGELPVRLSNKATPKVRCYLGMALLPCPDAYVI